MNQNISETAAGIYCVQIVSTYRDSDVVGDLVYVFRMAESAVRVTYTAKEALPSGIMPPSFVLYGSFKTLQDFLDKFRPEECDNRAEFEIEPPTPSQAYNSGRYFGYVATISSKAVFRFFPVKAP